ncbi:hypothetical protein PIB30_082876 [Stylosanthes scabra]|uniref:Uncharacterized protein n=1 Tax=Stylosanthes scabra TaxID=79078 RepID=A0ABU6UUF8_9FABA|nr:hypothetical protein [Stylosanthes scabra]
MVKAFSIYRHKSGHWCVRIGLSGPYASGPVPARMLRPSHGNAYAYSLLDGGITPISVGEVIKGNGTTVISKITVSPNLLSKGSNLSHNRPTLHLNLLRNNPITLRLP